MADDYGAQQRWMELASCVGDERFTGTKPDHQSDLEMWSICMFCEVFEQCEIYHDFPDVIGVFAAGSWRGECSTES